ncbi:TPA: metallophosphoesterase [Vibrio parahaemolyticus]|nr:metallophosphoesterase [Vibrio parahaemolyticus]
MVFESYFPIHQNFGNNTLGHDYFVGDIHGKYNLLLRTLKLINFNFNNDRLFSVGDTIDRGEDSLKCLSLAKHPWFIPVIGNHEFFLLECEENQYKKQIWYKNGGSWWEHLNINEKLLAKEIILKNFYLTISVDTMFGKIGIAHAEYPLLKWPISDNNINSETVNSLLWGRKVIHNDNKNFVDGIDMIVSGHTPIPTPIMQGNHLFIDTGCGHNPSNYIPNPKLTMAEFTKDKIIFFHVSDKSFEKSELNVR